MSTVFEIGITEKNNQEIERKETIEVIKNALIANGWKFVEKSERSKNKS